MPRDDFFSDAEILHDAIREIRRLAVAGAAPSSTEYTRQRRPGTPGVTVILRRLGLHWSQLARRAGLTYEHRSERHDAAALPAHVLNDINGGALCECGAPAVFIGRFVTLSPAGNDLHNAALFCEQCGALADAGVRLEPLELEVPA